MKSYTLSQEGMMPVKVLFNFASCLYILWIPIFGSLSSFTKVPHDSMRFKQGEHIAVWELFSKPWNLFVREQLAKFFVSVCHLEQ